MKTYRIFTYLFMFAAITFSCDELDELTEFDVSGSFNSTIDVNLTDDSEGEPVTLTETAAIDISSNPDIADNLNLIQNVTITALTFEIDNYVGAEDVTITDASISFGDSSINISDIVLKTADDGNIVYEVEDASQLNAIGDFLENNPVLNVTLMGTISATPALFDVIINLDTTVTIDAI